MATVVGPPVLDDSLQRALLGFAQPLSQGLVAGSQRREQQQQQQQQQAMQSLSQQLGINLPQGLPQQVSQAIVMQQLQQSMTQPEQFTLSPGEQRFTGQGQQVASIPSEIKAPTKTGLQAQEIIRLQEKEKSGTLTKSDQAKLDKLLVGQPLVEIGLGRPASAGERTAIADARGSLDALDNLKSLFKEEFVGPITGRTAPGLGLIGETTAQQEAFMASTSAFKNMIIKQITGAQMSEPEAKRIMKQIPDITDPPVRWKAKWEQSMKNIEMIQKRRLQVLGQSGIRVPDGSNIDTQSQPQFTPELEARLAELEAKARQ